MRVPVLPTMNETEELWSMPCCIVGSTGTRMDHHAGGFVYDRDVIIFKKHVERNLFCHGAQRWTFHVADNFNVLASAKMK